MVTMGPRYRLTVQEYEMKLLMPTARRILEDLDSLTYLMERGDGRVRREATNSDYWEVGPKNWPQQHSYHAGWDVCLPDLRRRGRRTFRRRHQHRLTNQRSHLPYPTLRSAEHPLRLGFLSRAIFKERLFIRIPTHIMWAMEPRFCTALAQSWGRSNKTR